MAKKVIMAMIFVGLAIEASCTYPVVSPDFFKQAFEQKTNEFRVRTEREQQFFEDSGFYNWVAEHGDDLPRIAEEFVAVCCATYYYVEKPQWRDALLDILRQWHAARSRSDVWISSAEFLRDKLGQRFNVFIWMAPSEMHVLIKAQELFGENAAITKEIEKLKQKKQVM